MAASKRTNTKKTATKKPQTKKPKASKSKTAAEPSNIESLEHHRDAGKAQWSLSENTTSAYAGQVKRARQWLADVVTVRKAAIAAGEVPIQGRDMDLDKLSQAFDEPPNRYTPYALELLLTEKCLVGGKSISTAQSAYSAMKNYWKTMPGGKYRGKWSVDEATGKVSGNPADAPDVQDILHAIQNKTRAAGGRDHAEAITIEDMRRLMRWSESVVSPDIDWAAVDITDVSLLLLVAKHLENRAFMPTGFTLWTRNAELCELRRRHYKPYCTSAEPYCQEYDEFLLENRKGWTSTNGSSATACQGHKYEVYAQNATPEIDAMRHMRAWIQFLEKKLLGRPLKPDEFLFPVISSTGLVYADKPIDHNVVQKHINEFAAGAGLTTQFTTHSFRRGGAQYRFMFCPIGERWSLAAVRWWGGWAKGEHAETLAKYLINELSSYEESHSDALASFRRDASRQFMGNHLQVIPGGTAGELRAATQAMNRKIEHLEDLTKRLSEALQGSRLSHQMPFTHAPHAGAFPAPSGHAHYNYPIYAHNNTMYNSYQSLHAPLSTPAMRSHTESFPPLVNTASSARPILANHHSLPVSSGAGPITPLPYAVQGVPGTGSQALPPAGPQRRPLPAIADAVIPKLPRGKAAWKVAVDQWHHPDARTGLALKDWPGEWYKGDMRLVNGAKYGQRRDIALEHIRLGSDDAVFLEQYPAAKKGVRELLQAIRKRHIGIGSRSARRSKNGTPAERNVQPASDSVSDSNESDSESDAA